MKNILSSLLIGICLGYINGISSSPVLATYLYVLIISSIISLALLSGIKIAFKEVNLEIINTASIKKAPVLLAALLLGFALGASGGIFVKNNDLIGTRPNLLVEKWYKGLAKPDAKSEDEIRANDSLRRTLTMVLFSHRFNSTTDDSRMVNEVESVGNKEDAIHIKPPPSPKKTDVNNKVTAYRSYESTYLLSGKADTIDPLKFLCRREIGRLREQVKYAHSPLAERLANAINNDTVLHNVICIISSSK